MTFFFSRFIVLEQAIFQTKVIKSIYLTEPSKIKCINSIYLSGLGLRNITLKCVCIWLVLLTPREIKPVGHRGDHRTYHGPRLGHVQDDSSVIKKK